jgi:hypothetical protein
VIGTLSFSFFFITYLIISGKRKIYEKKYIKLIFFLLSVDLGIMASSNKKSSTSHDVSTDTDDSDCAKDGSDSNTNDISSTTKHRG